MHPPSRKSALFMLMCTLLAMLTSTQSYNSIVNILKNDPHIPDDIDLPAHADASKMVHNTVMHGVVHDACTRLVTAVRTEPKPGPATQLRGFLNEHHKKKT